MSRRMQENLIAAAVVIILAGIIFICMGFGPRARRVPLPLAIFGMVLMVVQIVWQNLRSAGELKVDMLEVLTSKTEEESISEACASPAAEVETPAAERWPRWQKEVAANGIVLLFLGMIWLIGPIPAVFLFTGGYLFLSRHYPWLKSLAYALALTASIYLLFVTALDIQLYHGVLEPLVDRFR